MDVKEAIEFLESKPDRMPVLVLTPDDELSMFMDEFILYAGRLGDRNAANNLHLLNQRMIAWRENNAATLPIL